MESLHWITDDVGVVRGYLAGGEVFVLDTSSTRQVIPPDSAESDDEVSFGWDVDPEVRELYTLFVLY